MRPVGLHDRWFEDRGKADDHADALAEEIGEPVYVVEDGGVNGEVPPAWLVTTVDPSRLPPGGRCVYEA